jgi:hypothetical protein
VQALCNDGIWQSTWAPERGEERHKPLASRGRGDIKTRMGGGVETQRFSGIFMTRSFSVKSLLDVENSIFSLEYKIGRAVKGSTGTEER